MAGLILPARACVFIFATQILERVVAPVPSAAAAAVAAEPAAALLRAPAGVAALNGGLPGRHHDEQGPAENVTPAPGSQPAVCACSGSGRCPLGIQPAQKHAQESEEERHFLHTSQLMYPVRRCSGRTSARK